MGVWLVVSQSRSWAANIYRHKLTMPIFLRRNLRTRTARARRLYRAGRFIGTWLRGITGRSIRRRRRQPTIHPFEGQLVLSYGRHRWANPHYFINRERQIGTRRRPR